MIWSKPVRGQMYVQSGAYSVSACRRNGTIMYTPFYNAEIIGRATEIAAEAKTAAQTHNSEIEGQ